MPEHDLHIRSCLRRCERCELPQPYSRAMSRRDMADLITKTTHLVGCWVSRSTAQQMASDQKQVLSVTPTMQRQVEALR
jgi:hypothetical protein